MGSSYFKYDPFNENGGTNCQLFIKSLLEYNDLLTPELESFIYQDAEQIAQDISTPSKALLSGMTDLAARLDTVVKGQGFKAKKLCACK